MSSDTNDKANNAIQTILESILDLDDIEHNLFRGYTPPLYLPRIFGGQSIAQSLMAAYRTVGEGLVANSLHAYFLRPGDPSIPILYQVSRLRNGRLFASRHVEAIQRGKCIFSMTASFHRAEEGWSHQDEMPKVPPPESIPTENEMYQRFRDSLVDEPPRLKKFLDLRRDRPMPLDIRRINTNHLKEKLEGKKQAPKQRFWIKAEGKMSDDFRFHQCAAAYMSDIGLMNTALLPHGKSFLKGEVTGASVDHAMWFHSPSFRADQFLLYEMSSHRSGNALGMNIGRFFDRSGRLIITTAQEGLMRPAKRNSYKKTQQSVQSKL